MTIIDGVALTAANKTVNTVFDTWIFPKIRTYKNEFKQVLNLNFKSYLNRMYNDSSFINSLIFGKIPKRIEDLYVPLDLKSDFIEGNLKLDYPLKIKDFISQYNKIFIVDTAGMGKSTLLKWMFKKSIELNEGIPIFIDLRKLSRENSILNEINRGINGFRNNIDNKFLEKFILKGNFIFFLDGYDEIAPEEISYVTNDLQNFISNAYKNKFIISSRPNEILSSFNNFYTFHIEKLKFDETKELLRKYAIADKSIENTDNLIEELERRYYELEDFIETPLMVALLYKGYDYRKNIPIKKSHFYKQVYDALFQDHDMSKSGAFSRPKQSELDIEDFHTLINCLGYITFKLGLIGFNKDNLKSYIEEAIRVSEIQAPVLGVIEDLTDNVSLMHLDGNEYVWNHKSLQEYFAAKFICYDIPEVQEDLLFSIYNTRDFKKYDTLFSLCYEIKPQLFKKTVVKCFLKEVIEYHESFEFNYEIVPSYRKLLRELVFNNEYVLAVYKKDFIKQTYEEEWDTEIELLTKDDDKEAVKYRHFGFFFTLEYIDKYEKYNPTEITATIKEVNEYIVVLTKYRKEFRSLLNIFKSKEDYFINNLSEYNIPSPNLDKLIQDVMDDGEYSVLSVFSDEISDDSFTEELVINILSLIYNDTKIINPIINYPKAKLAYEKIEERSIPKGLFEF